ncbi:MAG TPA: efflux RND transporter periplasmic adaptor subunit [Terriglobales bacterium]|nr:efflux RND transporter periplasmic adaptor subunit [Terriglobales bacterium]
MVKRLILMLLIVAAVVAGLAYFKTRQIQAAMKQFSFTPPPESVTTITAAEQTWPSSINVVGTMAAVHGVTVSADLPGTVDQIFFDSGRAVKQGDVLLEQDTRQERAQLASLEATRDLNKINFERMQQLSKEGVISKMDYDKAAADLKQSDANVAEIKANIDRKTIHAPFSGVLGIRQANLGQYLAAGAAIVALQSVDPIYVNFGIPQQNVGEVKVGETIRLTSDSLPGTTFTGRVNALDSTVDPSTRNIQIQATVANPKGLLRPGMFVQVDVGVGTPLKVIPLPASAINYAPFGNSVYVVSEMKGPDGKAFQGVQQHFVKLQGSRGDQVGVASGINPGDVVVTSGVFKLRNGAAVAVNNSVQPSNSSAPKVEDN